MPKVIIIGAGPAGLAAGYELVKNGHQVTILELEKQIGGLCRTVDFQGYKFDFGGHRFFTKNKEVEKFWRDLLGTEFLKRPRLSRIYYRRRFFAYPIKLFDALSKLGLWESCLCFFSLISSRWRLHFHPKPEVTFEDWVVNRFGQRLYQHFFKSYTEKLWGISTAELGADWAAQRLKDTSLLAVLKSFFVKTKAKSWIEEFDYPKFGPGMMYEALAQKIRDLGGQILLGQEVISLEHGGDSISKVIIRASGGDTQELLADKFISSVPLNIMLRMLSPRIPEDVNALVSKMRFRAFFDVCLIVNKKELFPDNWIYVHEPAVKLLRVQNFKNWSPAMTADKNKTPIGAEYVCWMGDELWNQSDDELVALAKKELAAVGLLSGDEVESGFVIRSGFAYPVYHLDYQDDLRLVFDYLKQFKNFQTIGRSGLFRYNNMDHSILTGFYAARNIMGDRYNVLDINTDDEYHESEK